MSGREPSFERYLGNMVKGRICETVIEELLKKAGYTVYPFGYEKTVPSMTEDLESWHGLRQIKSMPDFLIKGQDRQSYLIEVKYRRSGILACDDIRRYGEHWPDALIFAVVGSPPQIRCCKIKEINFESYKKSKTTQIPGGNKVKTLTTNYGDINVLKEEFRPIEQCCKSGEKNYPSIEKKLIDTAHKILGNWLK